jgi:hypothetical protein
LSNKRPVTVGLPIVRVMPVWADADDALTTVTAIAPRAEVQLLREVACAPRSSLSFWFAPGPFPDLRFRLVVSGQAAVGSW